MQGYNSIYCSSSNKVVKASFNMVCVEDTILASLKEEVPTENNAFLKIKKSVHSTLPIGRKRSGRNIITMKITSGELKL
jgi:hypothetical protein